MGFPGGFFARCDLWHGPYALSHMNESIDWHREARRQLRIKLAEHKKTYGELATMLRAIGVEETERSIANKLSRGTFQFSFFLQCMKALGAESVVLDLGLNPKR